MKKLIEIPLLVQATDLQIQGSYYGGRETVEIDRLSEFPEKEFSRMEKVPTGRFYPKDASYGYERIHYYFVPA